MSKAKEMKYGLEVSLADIMDSAFGAGQYPEGGMTTKGCLINELEYNSEDFITALEENLGIPATEEAEQAYYDINLDEWEKIVDVDNSYVLTDIDDGRGGNSPTVSIEVNVTVDMAVFKDICEEHGFDKFDNKEFLLDVDALLFACDEDKAIRNALSNIGDGINPITVQGDGDFDLSEYPRISVSEDIANAILEEFDVDSTKEDNVQTFIAEEDMGVEIIDFIRENYPSVDIAKSIVNADKLLGELNEQISEATANQKTTFTKEDVTGSKLNSQDRLKSMLGKD